jgi:hypothetical protein
MPWSEAREFFAISKPRQISDAEPPCPVSVAPLPQEDAELASDGDDSIIDVVPMPAEELPPAKAAVNVEPAVDAVPKVNHAAKQDAVVLSPCEIDAATAFVQAVGTWDRAVCVLENVKDIVGGAQP